MAIESDKKYDAVWVSHSSISDFLKCPRLYYLANRYKDPMTGNKVRITNPHLILGQAVHKALEDLSVLPVEKRFKGSLVEKFEKAWKEVSVDEVFGNDTERADFKEKGKEMINRVENNPGPLEHKAVKIPEDTPHFWLSEKDNIILCGKVDWLEYVSDEEGVRLIDFKTGKNREDDNSLQLPIYRLLVEECQSHPMVGAGYWYLRYNDAPEEVELPDREEAYEEILAIALKIKQAREQDNLECSEGGCYHCNPYEKILKNEAKLVGEGEYGEGLYVV